MREMVKLASSRGVEVLLIGTPEPGFSVSPPAFYADIAKEFALPYEERHDRRGADGPQRSRPTRSTRTRAATASSPSAWPSS